MAAQVFHQLEPRFASELTSEITSLPEVVPQAKYEVLTEFLAVTSTLPGRVASVQQASEMVGGLIQSDPSRAAQLLRKLWLTPDHGRRYVRKGRPPQTWGRYQKVAILLSTMKPALRRLFLQELTEPERDKVQTAQKFMPTLAQPERLRAQLEVLEEFALPHCPGLLQNGEFRMMIGRQLGDLLRAHPEQFVAKARHLWLS